MTPHSPLPWMLNKRRTSIVFRPGYGLERVIATAPSDDPQTHADLEFAVRAANNHEALVSALRELVWQVREQGGADSNVISLDHAEKAITDAEKPITTRDRE